MKKILVAVDGSLASLHAARSALEIARALDATVTLACVVPPSHQPSMALADEVSAALTASAHTTLRDAAAVLEPALPVPDLRVLHGSIAETLAEVAASNGYDVVVCGNRGRGAVSRVLLGSVADRLVHVSQVPVLLIR